MARPRSDVPSGSKPEQAVDPGKAAAARQRRRRIALPRRISRQRHGEAHRVIGEARNARRRGAIGLGVARGELGPAARVRRREPAADQRRLPADIGKVPLTGAEELQALAGHAVGGKQRCQRLKVFRRRRQKQGIDLPSLHRVRHLAHRARAWRWRRSAGRSRARPPGRRRARRCGQTPPRPACRMAIAG